MISWLSFAAFLAAGITLHTGLYQLMIGLKYPQDRSALGFVALAASTAFYQISCGLLYSSQSLETALMWHRLNFTGIALIGLSLFPYIHRQLYQRMSTLARLNMLLLIIILPLAWWPSELALSLNNPVRNAEFLGQSFVELKPGILLELALLLCLLTIIHLLLLLAKYARGPTPSKHPQWPIFVAFTLFLLCAIHDVFVVLHLLTHPYVLEYGFLGIVLAITYNRSVQFLQLHQSVLTLTQTLEQRVKARTHELQLMKEKAEQATSIKSQFLANMSHELRTPMNGILSMNELMLAGNLSNEHRQQAAIIHKSGEQLLQLVNDILDFSKVEAGKLSIDPLPVHLPQLIDDALALVKHRIDSHQVELLTELDPEVQWVMCDPLRLHQVLLNLLSNAAKFTAQGSIQIRLELRNRQQIVIDVQDSGVGIADEFLPHVFDSFSQQDNSTTRRYGGSGLGLAISKQLMTLMQGSLQIHSRIQQGTLARLTLAYQPCAAPSSLIADSSPLAGWHGQALQLLLIEDNPVNTLVASKLLASFGLSVVTAENGIQGLNLAAQQRFDLILLDIQMPVLDGVDTCLRLRQLAGPDQHCPVLALTANNLNGDRERYLATGMNDHITKPLSLKQLNQVLLRLLPPPNVTDLNPSD